jgi:predicted amidohydrolase YtcJ
VDAHGHVVAGGLQSLSANLLSPPDGEVRSIETLQSTLRAWQAANAAAVGKANFILGFGYDDSQLAELRHPTRDELDAISTTIPVLVVHQSGHIGALNSAALAAIGYDASTRDPAGGVIRRRAGSQEPDGVLEESAFFNALPKLLGRAGREGFEAFTRAGADLWARFGYTTAQDGRATAAQYAVMQAVAADTGLPIDVVVYPDVLTDRDFAKGTVSQAYANRLRVGGVKLTIDGSVQGFTAWRDRPYFKPAEGLGPGYAGYAAVTSEQVLDAVDWAYANDLQILTHANGEAAMDLLIAAVQVATLKHGAGQDRRPVLIHGQLVRADQLDAFKRLGVLPSLFTMHTFYWGDWHSSRTLGPEMAENISPTGWVLQRGMRFTAHHDAPVAFPDSMRVLDATVTRVARGSGRVIGPDQRVDVMTALKAMTLWPAWQHREEDRKGSLEPGKLADFVVLSRDPTVGDVNTIDAIQVLETIKEGRTVYRRSPAEVRKAALTATPTPAGDHGLAGLLRAAAVDRELQALPPWYRSARVRADLEARAHDNSCVAPLLNELMLAMTAGPAEGAP